MPWPRTPLLAAQLIFPRWSTSRILAEMSIVIKSDHLRHYKFPPYFHHISMISFYSASQNFPLCFHDQFLFKQWGPTKLPAEVRTSIYVSVCVFLHSAWRRPSLDWILWIRIHKNQFQTVIVIVTIFPWPNGFAWLCSQQSKPLRPWMKGPKMEVVDAVCTQTSHASEMLQFEPIAKFLMFSFQNP